MIDRKIVVAMVVLCCSCWPEARGDDWPQWLGPKRDSVWREDGIVDSFPAEGQLAKWDVPLGGGYAGPAVVANKVYVMDYQRRSGDATNSASKRSELTGSERALCFDANDGSLLWKHEYECPYRVSYAAGPRATPTVADGKVYTLGTMGDLRCLDAETGKLIWSKDLKVEYKTETPHWGFAGHPLVDGQRLICLVGGQNSVAVAFDKDSGKEIWQSLSARDTGYCPPTIVDTGETRQLIIWHADAINGLDPKTGEVYWTQPLKASYDMPIAVPRLSGDLLFATGVTETSALFKLGKQQSAAEVVWRGNKQRAVHCANSTPFIADGVIYGVDQTGELRAVDLATGERLWETFAATTGERRARYATAFIVKHADRYFLFNDQGDLIMARLTRSGYDEIGRIHVLDPTNEAFRREVVWSHPAFANRSVYVRNDKKLVCVSLAAN